MNMVTREGAAQIVAEKKAQGLTVGYTSGHFDLVHPGHVKYLTDARSQCDFLVVGINSDASVRARKGPIKPICSDSDRAAVIAGLRCVDLVFIFSELNNNENVRTLKPTIYFKAGDYSKESLSSAPLVEEYGGSVVLIPLLSGHSSSSIVERIAHRTSPVFAPEELLKQQEPKPAVFLDRDGTLNTLQEYLSDPKLFELIPGVIEGLRILREAGFLLIVTTNQPGIGLGYFSREDLYRLNSKMMALLTKGGVKLDKIYFCPHSEAEACSCRKPKTGMIERASRELPVINSKRYVVGDMTSDVQFAKNAGCKAIQLKTGKAGLDGRYAATPDYWAEDLVQAAQWIIADAGL